MKILAIGDFHGNFPNKFKSIIKKEKIDLVVSNGDYFPFHFRKIWFKHCYRSGKNLWEVIGMKKYRQLLKKDLDMGEKALKKLNSLKVPVYTVVGNLDYSGEPHETNEKRYTKKYGKPKKWNWAEQDFFTPMLKRYKNIKKFTHSYIKFKGFIFIGAYGSTNPGDVKSEPYRKNRLVLDKLFKKFRKENKKAKVIFVSHNMPYHTKLDKIGMKAHELVRGKHYGSKLIRRLINTYQPILHFGGHIHEAWGKQYIHRTLSVNPGAAHEGKAAIITLEEGKIPKVKFIK